MSTDLRSTEDLTTTLSGTGGPRMLTLHDMCDATASGVESAQVRLTRQRVEKEVLDFCGHHFEEYELVLTLEGWVVTHDIRPNPEQRRRAAEPDTEIDSLSRGGINPFTIPGSPVNHPVSDATDTPDAGL